MSKYVTKQRRMLLEFLAAHPDEFLSAGEIAAAVQSGTISASAIYRNLAELEAEGRLRRVSRSGSRELFYQFMDAEQCRNCLHMSCTRCGRTFHMHNGAAQALIRGVAAQEAFALDLHETVLYGLCGACQHQSDSLNADGGMRQT